MKIQTSLVHLTALALLVAPGKSAQVDSPQARILSVKLDRGSVAVLHLKTGYITSVLLPEAVNAVVLGDPGKFKAEHSEAEPQLVFFKASSPRPAETNALITTRAGHVISITLTSAGVSAHSEPVDYILEYQRPRSFLIESLRSSFVIGETRPFKHGDQPAENVGAQSNGDELNSVATHPTDRLHWEGKHLSVAVVETAENGQDMTVTFSVLNSTSRTVELLPPQIQLAGTTKNKHGKAIKAEPVAIKQYKMATRRLEPGASTQGVVMFERPAFKEARERLLLEIAQAEEVDRPILAPIAFVGGAKGGTK